MPPISKYTFKHNHWTANISSLGALAPHECFKLEILVIKKLCKIFSTALGYATPHQIYKQGIATTNVPTDASQTLCLKFP